MNYSELWPVPGFSYFRPSCSCSSFTTTTVFPFSAPPTSSCYAPARQAPPSTLHPPHSSQQINTSFTRRQTVTLTLTNMCLKWTTWFIFPLKQPQWCVFLRSFPASATLTGEEERVRSWKHYSIPFTSCYFLICDMVFRVRVLLYCYVFLPPVTSPANKSNGLVNFLHILFT